MPTGIGGGTLYNAAIWWTGELTRELFDRALIVAIKLIRERIRTVL